jgi:16S rRNA (guanine527-N7)-methyltransferase
MNNAEELKIGIEQLGLDLNHEAQQKLLSFLILLQKWNKVFNLTAIRKSEQMISHHLLDSLAVLPHLWQGRWLDVGCGGGIPGLVLAIAKPEWSFTLLDSNSKKTSFVQQVVIELELKNVKVVCSRVEDVPQTDKYDGIISRAFAETAEFVRLTRHLLAEKGRWTAMKGDPEQELLRLAEDVEVESIVPLNVVGLDAARCLVILKVK